MSIAQVPAPSPPSVAERALRAAGVIWFSVAAAGQAAFIVFILAYYGSRTLSGDYARWNDKPLIDGHVPGDATGNLVFAAHVLLAAVVTLGGLLQLTPAVRRAWPGLHRWVGRLFMVISLFMALSGIWLVVVRGTYLSVSSAAAVLLNGALILAFVAIAWRHAVKRRFDRHKAWAMRTFMVVSGVWFLRVGLMGWVMLNGGPVGMTDDMSGPADVVLTFGSYLIPLAVLELYFAAQRSARPEPKLAMSALILAVSLFTAVGVFGAAASMWGPHIQAALTPG